MRFFRNRKEQSSTDSKKNDGFDLNDCLDYFSKLDKVSNKIIEQERQVLNGINNDLSSHEVDAVLNKSLIWEHALEKYDSVEDFNLINAEWFPRLRTYKISDKETESISSNESVGEIRVQIIFLLSFFQFSYYFPIRTLQCLFTTARKVYVIKEKVQEAYKKINDNGDGKK